MGFFMSIILKNSVIATCLISTSFIITACSAPKNTNQNIGKAVAKKYQGNIPTYYTVRSGDTLSQIAQRYGLDYRRLGTLNGLDSNYTIRVGQRLRLTQPNNYTQSAPRPQSPALSTNVPVRTQPQSVAPTQNSAYFLPTPANVNNLTPLQPQSVAPQTAYTPVVAPVTPITPKPMNIQPLTTNSNRWLPPVTGRVIRDFDKMANIRGVWFLSTQGAPVTASKDGKVAYVGNTLPEYGNLIMIEHPDSYVSVYGQLGGFSVREGDVVKAGQQIGTVGLFKAINQPVMEFQIRYQGQPINPTNMLK